MTEKDLLENSFRDEIYDYLLTHGYEESKPEDYNFQYAVDKTHLMSFIKNTQTQTWEKFVNSYGKDAEAKFLDLISTKIYAKGLLSTLKGEVSDYVSGSTFKLAYFMPTLTSMDQSVALAKANILSVRREFSYENKKDSNRVDLAVFLNGIPVIMLELKKQTVGWSAAKQGREQYMRSRDPKELIFTFNRRTLLYFTLDEFEAYMTTRLAKGETYFLPFDRGTDTGAANPSEQGRHPTSYVWEEILTKEMILRFVNEFMYIDSKGNMISPRYHQLRAVLRCEQDFLQHGVGGRYLIWHSAGSGKTKTIAWLSTILLNKQEINTVIVVSDRTVIDSQLGEELVTLYRTGAVKEVTSGENLKTLLDNGGYILVTTLQKFRDVIKELKHFPDRKYAFVIDEAHSSMAGKSFSRVAETLTGKTLEEATQIDSELDDEDDGQNAIIKERKYIESTNNASYFAFTATPKSETMELFGTRTEEGKTYFDKYSMRQAIEEGFILNPLNCYTQYNYVYKVKEKKQDEKEYIKNVAEGKVKSFVSSQAEVIAEKVNIMMDDFRTKRYNWLQGRAKAMIITSSRLHAVYFKQEVDKYIARYHLPIVALIAFTGNIEIDKQNYTEADMNGGYAKEDLRHTIHNHDEIRIIVVADKLQTGFDEDALSILYVDKHMGSAVKAVQTYSRINRPAIGKNTFIMDFANKADDIKAFFEQYYDGDIFLPKADEINPNILFLKRDKLLDSNVFDQEDVKKIYDMIMADKQLSASISSELNIIKARVKTKPQNEKKQFLGDLRLFSKLYFFISTVYNKWDIELGKFAKVTQVLSNILKDDKETDDFSARDNVELIFHAAKLKIEEEALIVNSNTYELPKVKTETRVAEPTKATTFEIVREFNAKYPEGPTEMEKQMKDLASDATIQEIFKNSTKSAALSELKRKVDSFIIDGILSDDQKKSEFYTELSKNKEALNSYVNLAAERLGNREG